MEWDKTQETILVFYISRVDITKSRIPGWRFIEQWHGVVGTTRTFYGLCQLCPVEFTCAGYLVLLT